MANAVRALQLHEQILLLGDALEATGGIEETLKWGQPSHLPLKPRVGSTIRVAVHDVRHLDLSFNCKTSLVDTVRTLFADELQYAVNRGCTLRCS